MEKNVLLRNVFFFENTDVVVGTNSKERVTMQETTRTMTEMRLVLDTMQQQLVDTYRTIRSNEASITLRMCGFPTTFDLWSFEQRTDIVKALNRGTDGRYTQVLERFGYCRTRATKSGVGFHHTLFPDLYTPLTVNEDTDIFKEWPAELINQVYLNDVILYKRNIASKGKMTRWINDTTRKRTREETLSTETPKRGRVEDEWSYGGF
jgi:hypothetical protein